MLLKDSSLLDEELNSDEKPRREQLMNILRSSDIRTIPPEEIDVLCRVLEVLSSSESSTSSDERSLESERVVDEQLSEKVSLDKENIRQYIDFLQEKFPGLTIKSIGEISGVGCSRLQYLLNHPCCKNIRCQEVESFFRLYEDLKSGKKTYEPSERTWKPGKREVSLKGISLDKSNLRQYIVFLQNTFAGLTINTISELAGMVRQRLNALLNDPNFNSISTNRTSDLFQVYEDLKSGKKT